MNFKFILILLLNISLNFSSNYAQRRRRTTTTTTTTESNDYALNDEEIISLVKNAESASTSTTRDFVFEEEEAKRTKTKVNRLLTTTTDKTAFEPIRETTPRTETEAKITAQDINSKNKTVHKIKSKSIFI